MAGTRRRAVQPRFVPPDETQLKSSHQALLGDYLIVLNYVTPRAAFAPEDVPPGFALVFRPALRLLVHAHIRKQLQGIADAYLQLAAAVDAEAAASYQRWLAETATSCSQARASLFTIKRPSVLTVIPTLVVVAPLVVAFASWYGNRLSENVDELPFSSTTYAVIGLVYVAFFGAVFGSAFFTAFRWKRILFASNPSDPLVPNAYASENALFQLLSRAKRVESPIDIYLLGALAFVIVTVGGSVVSWLDLPMVVESLLFVVLAVASGAAGWRTVREIYRRRASALQ